MTIHNLFSKRQKIIRGEVSDTLTYGFIPQKLRVQIYKIIQDAIGGEVREYTTSSKMYEVIHEMLCREYGRFSLGTNTRESHVSQVLNFLLNATNTDEVIDLVELAFKAIDGVIKEDFNNYQRENDVKLSPDQAIEELNMRFRENGIGYAFEGGEIIRIDSTFTHSEITKPTLTLLSNDKFNGANEEYLKAHEHYRHGRNKECLAECLKAFESTLKVICKEKGWNYKQSDTSNKLIQVCLDNGLLPVFIQKQFTSLKDLLESGVSTVRNNLSGHGQGQTPIVVSDEITRYGLNLAGTNIVFLVEQSGIE